MKWSDIVICSPSISQSNYKSGHCQGGALSPTLFPPAHWLSLSWFSSPSRPGKPPHHQARMNLPALLLITLALLTSPSLQLREGKSAVRYLGDTFLLPDGCPSDNPLVQR